MILKWLALVIIVFSSLVACTDKEYRYQRGDTLIAAQGVEGESSTAGNLMATAIRETHNLDVVFYPRPFISTSTFASLNQTKKLDTFGMERILDLFPVNNDQDQFKLGTMKGEAIRNLVLNRSKEFYGLEIDVAGIKYDIHFIGGVPQYQTVTDGNNRPLKLDQYYRVAISESFYFAGAFPGYKYRNGLNFSFSEEGKIISAREALKKYLQANSYFPLVSEIRAKVSKGQRGNAGRLKISQIQGKSHKSPYFGYRATTRGVVTATGAHPWYPGGLDVYIQSLEPDNDIRTSEGLKLHFRDEINRFEIGDYLEVTGVVYEDMTGTGLGVTSIRDITSFRKISESVVDRPRAIALGDGGRKIPDQVISSYLGNLNDKAKLNLKDGIDFWESLEGMRVSIKNPSITDFRGGLSDYEDLRPSDYLNLYVKPDANRQVAQSTDAGEFGGMIVHEDINDYNPEVMQVIMNHMSQPMETDRAFNVGAGFLGTIEGVLGYEKNLFGSGEYVLMLSEPQNDMTDFINSRPTAITELKDRGEAKFESDPDHLVVASMNVENLAGYQVRRIEKLGEAIKVNMKCPDIINFVEIQDENGIDFEGSASARVTLDNIVRYTNCPGRAYGYLNIDPVVHAEGGQPGGNIRMAMMYDMNKIGFTFKDEPHPLAETILDRHGNLRQNPGRIFPNDEVFEGTRRSLIAQFEFKGESIFIIGNHFNSKLGDSNKWGAEQPAQEDSESERARIADRINDFVEFLSNHNPRANILVVGDFNALPEQKSMRVLEGTHLKNMVRVLVPKNKRYSTTHSGSSQALDYIFANKRMMNRDAQVQIINMNSDFMGRLSDHDPVVSRFKF